MRLLQDVGQKAMPVTDLLAKLIRRIDRRIDFSPQPFLSGGEGFDDSCEGQVPDHQEVDVAVVAQLAPGGGAEDQGEGDAVGERG
jgi:hypothetical protein